jgi:hypothetical protein
MAAFVFFIVMRPKARGLAQHGGLLEESDPGKCDFLCYGWSVSPVFSVYLAGCSDSSCPAVS